MPRGCDAEWRVEALSESVERVSVVGRRGQLSGLWTPIPKITCQRFSLLIQAAMPSPAAPPPARRAENKIRRYKGIPMLCPFDTTKPGVPSKMPSLETRRKSQTHGGGGYPPVGIVFTLRQGLSRSARSRPGAARRPERGQDPCAPFSRPDSSLRAPAFACSPLAAESAIAQLSGRLKGNEGRSSDDYRLTTPGQRRTTHEISSEHVVSMTIGTSLNGDGHSCKAARNAAPSSSSRSSMTISSCGGSGRARRNSSSMGSSRCPGSRGERSRMS